MGGRWAIDQGDRILGQHGDFHVYLEFAKRIKNRSQALSSHTKKVICEVKDVLINECEDHFTMYARITAHTVHFKNIYNFYLSTKRKRKK